MQIRYHREGSSPARPVARLAHAAICSGHERRARPPGVTPVPSQGRGPHPRVHSCSAGPGTGLACRMRPNPVAGRPCACGTSRAGLQRRGAGLEGIASRSLPSGLLRPLALRRELFIFVAPKPGGGGSHLFESRQLWVAGRENSGEPCISNYTFGWEVRHIHSTHDS